MTSELWAEPSQILGFVAGAAVVAVLDPHKTLGIDDVTFGLSAVILLTGVRSRPAPGRAGAARASLWSVSADGVRIVFGSRLLLTLLQFGWLAGFYIVPEGLAAPYARSLHGNALTVGLLMAWAVLVLVDAGGRGRRLPARRGRRVRAGAAPRHQGPRVRRRPGRPGRPDRGDHARHELDAPARPDSPGHRTGRRALAPAARSAAC